MKKKSLNSKLVLNKKTITNLNLSKAKGGAATTEVCLETQRGVSCDIECRYTFAFTCDLC